MPLLALGSLLCTLLFQQAPVNLGSFKLDKKDVQAVLPSDVAPEPGGEVEFKGWKYEFSPKGDLVGRRLGAGGWDELRQLYAAKSSAAVAEWRAKFLLFTYADILDKGEDGVLRVRRTGFFGADIKGALDSIALFGSMIEAYSGGKLKFVPEVQLEEEPMRFRTPTRVPFDEKFAEHYFESRVNGGAYQAEDKVYRGPYNSIFFLHCGLTENTASTEVHGMPIDGLPFYYDFDNAKPGQLARRFFNTWIRHLIYAACRHGYQLGDILQLPEPGTGPVPLRLPYGLISDSMWQSVCNAKETSDYPQHFPAMAAGPQLWSKVSSEPWTQLPRVSAAKLTEEAGSDPNLMLAALNKDVPVGIIQRSSHPLLVCEPEYADFVAANLQGESDPKCVGFAESDSGPKIVFESSQREASLKVPSLKPALAQNDAISFKKGDPGLAVSGYTLYKIVDDAEQGKAALVEDNWVVRNGRIRLFGAGDPASPLDTSNGKYLDILVKAVSNSFAVTLVGPNGVTNYDLFSSNPSPAEKKTAFKLLDLKSDGGWQHAVIDLSGAGPISGIYLTAGNAKYWPVSLDKKPAILVGEAKLLGTGTATPFAPAEVLGSAASPDPGSRARFVATVNEGNYASAKASLQPLLKDPSELVEVNAAAAFTRIKDPKVEDALADLTKSVDPTLAEVAIEALTFQGTDTARGPIIRALRNGPFDANKYFATLALAPQKDPTLAEPFSELIIERNWQTRLAGVQALAAMSGETPQRFLLALLVETNPEIEVAIAQLASRSQDLFQKRMEWYAVNDPSDLMRASSNIALIESPLPGYPEEGFKGIHDDSYVVRKLILHHLAAHPIENARPAVLSAIADPSPEVRVAALDALSSLSAIPNLQELESVKVDKDPRVQLALISLAKKKNIKLDPATLDVFKNSVDPNVVEQAKALQG